MSEETICGAISSRNWIQFYYTGDDMSGIRTVERHMVAYTTADNLVLSGWFLGGASESQDGQGWREYLISQMANVIVLPQKFFGPRPGYNRSGGKKLHNVQCAL
jgi:hypothetical protein